MQRNILHMKHLQAADSSEHTGQIFGVGLLEYTHSFHALHCFPILYALQEASNFKSLFQLTSHPISCQICRALPAVLQGIDVQL